MGSITFHAADCTLDFCRAPNVAPCDQQPYELDGWHVTPLSSTGQESPVTSHFSSGCRPSVPNATIWCSMTPANAQPNNVNRPRVGIPWRTSNEEEKARTSGPKGKPG